MRTSDEICPACGNPSDYCQGHGEIGDPEGFRIVLNHYRDADHSDCHPDASCQSEEEK